MPGLSLAAGPDSARAGSRAGLEFTPADRGFLLDLQRRALLYFVENQAPCGLILDRQANHGSARPSGTCSSAATGMGLIALVLASGAPHRLISRPEALIRVRSAVDAALHRLPSDGGMMPHFVDASAGTVLGFDATSTVDSSWLIAGALWAAAELRDPALRASAQELYDRIDWAGWAAPSLPDGAGPLLLHGRGRDGRRLRARWDRLNGETIAMYVLAAGAEGPRALPPTAFAALRPFYGTVAGYRFNNADLGLFVFQYGLDLLDLNSSEAPGGVDLEAEAAIATAANAAACRELAARFPTYRRYWGLSAGDGPGPAPGVDAYRDFAPGGPIDGTAHLTATLASIGHHPGPVLENLWTARRDRDLRPLGRYGFSTVNLGVHGGWIGRDMVAIDAGAAILALENVLAAGRVRAGFGELACVRRGLDRLGFARDRTRRAS